MYICKPLIFSYIHQKIYLTGILTKLISFDKNLIKAVFVGLMSNQEIRSFSIGRLTCKI